MADIRITQSGREFNTNKGAGSSAGFFGAITSKEQPKFRKGDYADWNIPEHDMASLSKKKIEKALDYYIQYKNTQDPITFENNLRDILGQTNIDNKLAYLDYVIDKNIDKTGFDSSGKKYVANENGEMVPTNSSSMGYDSGLDYYKQLIEDSLATNKNSEFAKQYQADMYSNINSYEQATNATLASAELDAYRMLGQQQLQLENQIASERMQALKAGTTSAQLASRELANMFAAQSSAQQIAQNVLGRRADTANTFNQQRAGVVDSMYNMLANNQTTAANAYAQLGAAQASYNSYMQQPYASYDALMKSYNQYGSNLEKAMGYKQQ
jgi:hypothetical protein